MLAHLQRGIVAGLVLLAVAWGLVARDWPGWVQVAGYLMLAAGHVLFLACEFLLMHVVNRGDPAPRASCGALLRAWAHECVAAPRVFLWQQPFRSQAWPDRVPEPAPGTPVRRGVVLVHGFVCNRGLWNRWLQRLHQQRRVVCAVNLEPVFGSIDDYVPAIDAAVHRVTQATGQPPLVVCHSMGGLAVRAWLRALDADKRVAQVVTLGTPHHGTWLARFSVVANASQMRRDSRWLAQLRRDEPPARGALFTCYYSACDNIVFPTSTAVLPGAHRVLVPGVAHVALVFDAAIMDEVLALPGT